MKPNLDDEEKKALKAAIDNGGHPADVFRVLAAICGSRATHCKNTPGLEVIAGEWRIAERASFSAHDAVDHDRMTAGRSEPSIDRD